MVAQSTSPFKDRGGSLSSTDPTYVTRPADQELYETLIDGEFCYVFNSRQMGKSSLAVRVRERLEKEKIACVVVDLSGLGSQITPEEWYMGIAYRIMRRFRLSQWRAWWKKHIDLSPVQRLGELLHEVLLPNVSQPIVIFIDEIDSVRSFQFPTDDLFALIRACHNERGLDQSYSRLTFCLLGVACPSKLIADKERTPFNLGRAVELTGFSLQQALKPLTPGLATSVENSAQLLSEILYWTGGQPFLTQKLCHLVVKYWRKCPNLTAIVQTYILDNWEAQDEPEHLRTIRDRILRNERNASQLLGLYQQILQRGQIADDGSFEQLELQLTGLVVKDLNTLRSQNPIYTTVFNSHWVEIALTKLRPSFYAEAIRSWQNKDEKIGNSFLLRGQALREAESWAKGKRLGDEDRRFLDASQLLERQVTERQIEVEQEEQRILKTARRRARAWSLMTSIISSIAVVSVGLWAANKIYQVQQEVGIARDGFQLEQQGALSLRQFQMDESGALIRALKAAQGLQNLLPPKEHSSDAHLINYKLNLEHYPALSPHRALQEILLRIHERPIAAHQGHVWSTSWSSDGKILATGGEDGTVKLWSSQGKPIKTLRAHKGTVYSMSWSSDGQILATGGFDGIVRLWNSHGKLLRRFQTNHIIVTSMSWSSDGQILATGGLSVKVWNRQGKLLTTLKTEQGRVMSMSWNNDGQTLATGGEDGYVKLWSRQGKPLKTLRAHEDTILGISWSNDGQILATGGEDGYVKLWNKQGKPITSIRTAQGKCCRVSWSSDGEILATGGLDGTVKLWNKQGKPIITLRAHEGSVLGMSWSRNDQILATSGWDGMVKLWSRKSKYISKLRAHEGKVLSLNWSSDGQILATGGEHGYVKLWNKQGKTIKTLRAHEGKVLSLNWSSDGQILATGGEDGYVKLWNKQGKTIKTLRAHEGKVLSLNWSSDGQILATGGEDGYVKLWNKQGKTIKTFRAHEGEALSLNWSSDGQTLTTVGRGGIVGLWSKQGKLLTRFQIDRGISSNLDWNRDGLIFAVGGWNGKVKLWSKQGKLLTTLDAHKGIVFKTSWSKDGQTLATTGQDGEVKLWSRQGKLLTTLDAEQGIIRSMSWTSSDQTLATGGQNGSVKFWQIEDLDTLLKRGCDWLEGYLITTPHHLQELKVCQTPARRLAAAPYLIKYSEGLAKKGLIKEAIQGFREAQKWDANLQFDPELRAKKLIQQTNQDLYDSPKSAK